MPNKQKSKKEAMRKAKALKSQKEKKAKGWK